MVICADMCFDCFPDFPAGSMPCNIQNYYNFEDVKLKVIKTNAIETEHIFGDRWKLGCWPKARGEPGAGSPGAAAACPCGTQSQNVANRKTTCQTTVFHIPWMYINKNMNINVNINKIKTINWKNININKYKL